MKMSESRRRVFEFIKRFISERGYSPSHKEICEAVYISQPAVKQHIDGLKDAGLIDYEPGKPRTIRVLEGAK